tara:strand:+ start:2660 stop:3475 length:816 start_codon:yes stop_codon:yes gene_type:complete
MKNIFNIFIESYRRDLGTNLSYRLNFVGELMVGILSLTLIFFFSELIENADNSYLEKYNNNYFLFLLTGMTTILFISRTFSSIPLSISSAQTLGYFENLVTTKTNIFIILLSNGFFSFTRAIIRIALIYFFALLLSSENLSFLKLAELFLLLIFSSLPFVGVAFLFTSLLIVYKKANFFNSLFLIGCTIFSGAIYPTDVMPNWLSFFSYIFPTTFSLEIIRGRIIEEISYENFYFEIGMLSFMSLVFIYSGMQAIKFSINKAKQDGSISHF